MTIETETRYKTTKIGNVNGLGEIHQVRAPLPEQILTFQNTGIKYPFLATPEEVVRIRIAGLSNDFSRTSVAPIGVKGENTILYKTLSFDESRNGYVRS